MLAKDALAKANAKSVGTTKLTRVKTAEKFLCWLKTKAFKAVRCRTCKHWGVFADEGSCLNCIESTLGQQLIDAFKPRYKAPQEKI